MDHPWPVARQIVAMPELAEIPDAFLDDGWMDECEGNGLSGDHDKLQGTPRYVNNVPQLMTNPPSRSANVCFRPHATCRQRKG